MTEDDFATFDRAFRRLSGGYRLKVRSNDLDDLVRMYFRVLEAAPLDTVLSAGKVCLETLRTFPKPVDWLEAIRSLSPAGVVGDIRTMTDEEAAAWSRAERQRWQDEPCRCLVCQAAGVTHRFLRFVPEFTDAGADERAFHPGRQRIVTTGHWAHGEELGRWYTAGDAFYGKFPRATRMVPALVGTEP